MGRSEADVLAGMMGADSRRVDVLVSDVAEVKGNETTLPDGTREQFLGLAEASLVPLLAAALQEQQAIIEDLAARVRALEGA
mgnify:FL=1